MKKIAVLFTAILFSIPVFSQTETIPLLKPTGIFPIGTLTYEWTDESRTLQYSLHEGDKRTIIAQFWYPSQIDSTAQLAPYSALSKEKEYLKVTTNSLLRPSFSDEIKKAPLVLISPGRGMERFVYSTIAEDLASNGFIVLAVDMPEIGYTIYQDGLIVKPSPKYKTPGGMMAGPYEKVDDFFKTPTKIGYEDLEFVLKKITALNEEDIDGRFTNRIDLENIGIFGHSLGGRIAGALTAKNTSIKAYISMEGIPPRAIRFKGEIKIPTVMLCSSGTLPYAIENYNSFTANRSAPVFMIELLNFGHNSVTDNPFIAPSNYNYGIDAGKGLEISRNITTSYFQTYLRQENSFLRSIKNIDQIRVVKHN